MSLQSCLTLCGPVDCNLPISSVHGILQARILEWVAMPSFRGLPDPGIEPASLMSPALAWASLVIQMAKNLPAVQETQVQSLGGEDPWIREWQPIPVFMPGEFHGQRSLVGYSPWGHKESDQIE